MTTMVSKSASLDEVVVNNSGKENALAVNANGDVFTCEIKWGFRKPFAVAGTAVFLMLSAVSIVFMVTSNGAHSNNFGSPFNNQPQQQFHSVQQQTQQQQQPQQAGTHIIFEDRARSSGRARRQRRSLDEEAEVQPRRRTRNSNGNSNKRDLKKNVFTINFEETFNPTPSRLHPTTLPTDSPVQEQHKTKKTKKTVDTINFEETFNPTPSRLHPTTGPTKSPVEEHKSTKKTKKNGRKTTATDFYSEDGKTRRNLENGEVRDLKTGLLTGVFAPGAETYAPTPESWHSKKTLKPTEEKSSKRTLTGKTVNAKDIYGKDFTETFAPTPENKKRDLKSKVGVFGKDFTETLNPTPENRKKHDGEKNDQRALGGKTETAKDIYGKNFEETFNPTPENKKRDLKNKDKNFEETYNPTPKYFNKDKKHETYNPTPEDFNPSDVKKGGKRTLTGKTVNAKDIYGKDFTETFAPTPENKKRDLKSKVGVFGKDFTETLNPTPENRKKHDGEKNDQRALGGKTETAKDIYGKNFEETFNPTPEDKNKKHDRALSKKSVDGKNFEETRNPTPEYFNKDKENETYNPTPEDFHSKDVPKNNRELSSKKSVDGKNFEETRNPTPEYFNKDKKHETYQPTPEDFHSKDVPKDNRALKHTGKETFAPTPESFKSKKTLKPSMWNADSRRELATDAAKAKQ